MFQNVRSNVNTRRGKKMAVDRLPPGGGEGPPIVQPAQRLIRPCMRFAGARVNVRTRYY